MLLRKMRPEPKILIVEDDAAVRDIVQIALEGEGMAVEAVENGRRRWSAFAPHIRWISWSST